jgi:hypothetical protein
MTKFLAAALLAFLVMGTASWAQQNQTPGDTTAGGGADDGVSSSKARTAQSGANTTDGTTTGSSGPEEPGGGPPGDLALPPLPSADLCSSYQGEVQAACLATTLYQRPETVQEPQNDQ